MRYKIKFHFVLITLCAFCNISADAQTVYKDVAPIFIANCTGCHHSGGIEFPLTNYSSVVAKAGGIYNALQIGYMPPWPPDPTYKSYVHERIISASDKNLILNWINNGTPAGDTTLAPPVPTYSNKQLNGTPDLILKLPKYTSTSTTTDKYVCLNVPSNLTQDRYIRAFEYIPGNAAIIHHAVITIDTTGTAVDDLSGGCYNFQGQINIGDYAPGMGPTVLPNVVPTKFGFKLKAGSTVSFQLHVPHGTSGMEDSSELHIYFYPINEPNIRDIYFQTVLQNWNFYVPANTVVTASAKYPTGSAGVPVDVSLYGAFPHSHNTCTSIINYGYNGTDTIPLVKIPKWNFHWQGQYNFKNLVKLPQNYHIYSSHVFDNTSNNPLTPNPNVAVQPGTDTDDEMLFDSYLYALYQSGDELVDIASILANNPLFWPTSTSNVEQTILLPKVFPNPFSNETIIQYNLLTSQYVQITITNILGQEVKKVSSKIEGQGLQQYIWNGTNEQGEKVVSGIYIYTIQAGKNVNSGKIILE